MGRMARLVALAAAALATLALGLPAQAAGVPAPSSMASTGDSITRGFNATWWGCFFSDCPQYSWSTGSSSSVQSQYLRLLALNPALSGHAENDAKTGARMSDLYGQLDLAASHGVQYVTVLMGANDVCASNTSGLTAAAAATFDQQFAAALANFFNRDSGARVYVSSLPNLSQLYSALATNSSALATWGTFGTCQDVLPPGGTRQSRATVYSYEQTLNGYLSTECGHYANCRYDTGAGFRYAFTAADISTIDYFHPSVTGQRDIAALTWKCSFWSTVACP